MWITAERKHIAVNSAAFVALKNRHFVFSSIILAIIILTSVQTPCFAAENSIDWTENELAFIREHPVIRLGIDPGFVPFEFIDENGEYKGITADYLALISEKTGLKFEVAAKGLAWPEVYDMALKGPSTRCLPLAKQVKEKSTSSFRNLITTIKE